MAAADSGGPGERRIRDVDSVLPGVEGHVEVGDGAKANELSAVSI